MATSRTMLGLLRACHPEPAAAVTAGAGALAVAAGHRAGGVGAVIATVAASQLAVGWHNDWLDAARDQASARRDKPIAAGVVTRRSVGLAALAAAGATVVLAPMRGSTAAAAALAGLVAGLSYNWPLKFTWLSMLPYLVAFAALPAYVVLALPGAPLPPWWLVLAGALLGAGAHLANVLADLDDDARTGVRGMAHRLGATASTVLAAMLLSTAMVLLAFGPAGPPSLLALLALTAAVGVLGLGGYLQHRDRRSRAAFRSVLIAALLVVAQLLFGTGGLTAP